MQSNGIGADTDDTLELYAMKGNLMGMKSKCKHETYRKKDSPSRSSYVFNVSGSFHNWMCGPAAESKE